MNYIAFVTGLKTDFGKFIYYQEYSIRWRTSNSMNCIVARSGTGYRSSYSILAF